MSDQNISSQLKSSFVEVEAMKGAANSQSDWIFWLKWILANVVALAVGWPLGWAVVEPRIGPIVEIIEVLIVFGVACVIPIGIGQWFVLRQKFWQVNWWTLPSVVGWGLGGVVSWSVLVIDQSQEVTLSHLAVVGAISGVIIGAITGLLLVWLLRKEKG